MTSPRRGGARDPLPADGARWRPVLLKPPPRHRPFATAAFLGLNLAAFLAIDPPLLEALALHHGEGMHPWQWGTANFLHGGWSHLVINLLGFALLGVLVEGRLGWRWFTAVCVVIGVGECAVEQWLMLAAPGGRSFGASGIVFGLLGLAVARWPRGAIGLRLPPAGEPARRWSAPLWGIGLLAAGSQFLLVLLPGSRPGGPHWHLLGAAIGLLLGLSLRQLGAWGR